jgi:hypothetical protein
MTYRAYYRPSNMPAEVPGVPTALAREDRLRLRAGCANSRLATPPRRAGAGR